MKIQFLVSGSILTYSRDKDGERWQAPADADLAKLLSNWAKVEDTKMIELATPQKSETKKSNVLYIK
jgi:hypothetical protein